MIKNIVFDFGKVLIDYDFQLFIDGIFQNRDNDKKEFTQLMTNQDFVDESDLELIPFADLMRRKQNEYPRFAQEMQIFSDCFTDAVTHEMPGMKALMERLKGEGFRLYGLSNWSSKVYEVMNKFPEIFTLLEGSVISCEEHLIKPDIAIYHRLCEKYSLCADECIFTDDKLNNILGAQKAGLQTILFQNTRQLEQELKQLIVMQQW